MLTLPQLLHITRPTAAQRKNLYRFVDGLQTTAQLPVDVWISEESAIVRAEVPGLRIDDIQVEVDDNGLRLSGERTADKDRTYLRRERFTGRFDRRVQLPFAVDAEAAQAHLTNGVLEIRLPRLEADKPRKIAVVANS